MRFRHVTLVQSFSLYQSYEWHVYSLAAHAYFVKSLIEATGFVHSFVQIFIEKITIKQITCNMSVVGAKKKN